MKANTLLCVFFIVLIFMALSFVMGFKFVENFAPVMSIRWPRIPPLKRWFVRTNNWWPWWNSQIGTTRNMSYDLRGDPFPIPRYNVGPWNNSSISPIYNKPLWMVS